MLFGSKLSVCHKNVRHNNPFSPPHPSPLLLCITLCSYYWNLVSRAFPYFSFILFSLSRFHFVCIAYYYSIKVGFSSHPSHGRGRSRKIERKGGGSRCTQSSMVPSISLFCIFYSLRLILVHFQVKIQLKI